MRTAKVILDIPTKALDGAYTYLVPDGMEEAEVGCAVLVPFGGRQAVGFVMGLDAWADERELEERAGVAPGKLRPVARVLTRSYFDENSAACAEYLARTCIAPLSSCVRLFTPPGGVPRMVRQQKGYWRLEQPSVGEVDDRWVRLTEAGATFEPRANAMRQKAVVEALRQGELRFAELSYEFGNVGPVIKALEGKGVVAVESRRRMRGMEPPGGAADYAMVPLSVPPLPALTKGQEDALACIRAAVAGQAGRVVLVDGVTGSGKTEVYLRAIDDVVRCGRTAIVLVPEISLTPQTVARFRARFGDMVAVLHSRMSDGERYDQWDFIRSGQARVVVGARSALFSPVRDLGLVVIDEEHESTYKQDQAPRYHARTVATWMVRHAHATLVLGSATPSIESLYHAAKDPMWSQVVLPARANGRPLPAIEVVDMAREFGQGSRSMFSRRLSDELHGALRAGSKAVLMLNQRGFAQFLLCRECGFVPECPDCSTSLTYHERGSKLVCHHCGRTEPAPPRCPRCGSPYLKRFGAGTQRVEAELAALIEGFGDVAARIVRMDADTTSRKGAHQRLLEEFAAPGAAVLLGTQMIAKGLDFDDVVLVGAVNADTQLRLPDFRAAERTFSLIEQVAGRAGRGRLEGKVLVQTYAAGNPAIRAAAAYDRALFLRDELPKRKALGFPPYVRLADVLCWGPDEAEVAAEAGRIYDGLRAQVDKAGVGAWTLLPPTPCVLARIRGSYRYHITVKAPADAPVADVLSPVFRAHRPSKAVNSAIDIDPSSML